MTVGDILLIAAAIILVLTSIGFWMKKRSSSNADAGKKITENVADLNDKLNRARYMNQDGQ